MTSEIKLPWDTRPVTVAVVGDLILDEYLDGVVNRISPEAPVPVHLVRSSSVTAGGAANVARNIQLAGGCALMIGVCGADVPGNQLKDILISDGIDVSGILIDRDRPTIKKTRITANHQQLVRIDWEEVKAISPAMQDTLYKHLEAQKWDVLVLSDYGKGGVPKEFMQRLIALGRARKVPVVIDPKGKDYAMYAGATLITPNRKEACEALGWENTVTWPAKEMANALSTTYAIDNILVTLGPEGMIGLNSLTGEVHQLPAKARDVFDVSGAGDTVVSIMALALGSKASLFDAMVLANAAAGRVVEKWGTQPIYREELLEALVDKDRNVGFLSTRSKIRELTQLKQTIGKIGKRKKKVVFTNGCFDLLHAGHISYLEEARAKGDLLIIGVNSDASLRRLKGATRPIVSLVERMRLLASLAAVDYVLSFDDDTPANLIKELMPDVLAKGADYEIHQIVGADTVMDAGGKVERIPFVPGLSTSDIVKRIQANQGVIID
ncbi:MAG: D-glycero-beta-D-manno-heptose 1-phosphate adenylyltransferase [Chitinophagaceae bacterium]|nr:D-glycero-beta-D-manno-heptose 1-phosphate adenylyltransferase [Oligoflexus sp.]